MDTPLEKMLKILKSFNAANMMNEVKCEPIRETIIEGYELILENINFIPDHLLE